MKNQVLIPTLTLKFAEIIIANKDLVTHINKTYPNPELNMNKLNVPEQIWNLITDYEDALGNKEELPFSAKTFEELNALSSHPDMQKEY